MQTKQMTSEQARKIWGELIDTVLAGATVSITRHSRPVAVVISAQLWENILDAYDELDDARDRLAVYRAEIKRLRGERGGRDIPHEEADEWLIEDEPIPA